ncbi:MAG: leucine-rich repeat protein [Atopobiaceae bacterium]|nr:leucine-rich repeat protein [Atopobiaceae bacterium]
MPLGFQIEGTTLVSFNGPQDKAEIPKGVTVIGKGAFEGSEELYGVTIPDGVTAIEEEAFSDCVNLRYVIIPDTVQAIGAGAFQNCRILAACAIPESVTRIGEGAFCHTGLKSVSIPSGIRVIENGTFLSCWKLEKVTIPDGVREIGSEAFRGCRHLQSITIPGSVKKIGDNAFDGCEQLATATMSDGVISIGAYAFFDCESLVSVSIPDSVIEIGRFAFQGCKSLTSFAVPPKVKTINVNTFYNCASLASVTIPQGLTEIGPDAFRACASLASLAVPKSVKKIGKGAFSRSRVTVICAEGSRAHAYCVKNKVSYILDFQYEAFGGLLPQGFQMLASPFLADEEKPFIFISYSHRDRDRVLDIIKGLYEAGWKVWYDEGLTIGDRYDETLESHVENCSAFLLFVTENSLQSFYVRENEIPWAKRYGKPIIKCILDEGTDYDTAGGSVVATVGPSEIESALGRVSGLTKGKRRVAKGISVAFNPAERRSADGDGFAYCLYSTKGQTNAWAILREAQDGGCKLYDAVMSGADEEKLRDSACLIVFLDKAFLADKAMTKVLTDEYNAGRDIAVCLLENIEDADLPAELVGLHKMQWLNFAYGITADMNVKLARHLQKRGCRNTAVLPGFEYEKTATGIVIKRYTGVDPRPRIESEYGGVPVIEIADAAFKGCTRLESIAIPDGVRKIGRDAFMECTGLKSVTIPGSVRSIGYYAFKDCHSLTSVEIPKGVTEIDIAAFTNCRNLASVILPEGLTKIEGMLFDSCESLTSVNIPDSVTEIERMAFADCRSLTEITIPDSVRVIGDEAFAGRRNLTVICSGSSAANRYCKQNRIKCKSPSGGSFFGLFSRRKR